MHHLFAGLPVRQLGAAPYVAAESAALDVRAADLGLVAGAGARLYSPPVIAGYVGGDHVAMLLASGIAHGTRRTLALDIGTNTEISIARDGQLWSCSTASGPAFEGAHISDGMRAAPGAIERVRYHDGAFEVQTVGDRPPVGVCGSGMLDAIAAALDAGIIDRRGALRRSHHLVSGENGSRECLLVPADAQRQRAGHRFTRADVGEIQLARGAIRAGTALLLEAAGLDAADLDEVIVAGAFGTYLDLRSAVRVGLLPAISAGSLSPGRQRRRRRRPAAAAEPRRPGRGGCDRGARPVPGVDHPSGVRRPLRRGNEVLMSITQHTYSELSITDPAEFVFGRCPHPRDGRTRPADRRGHGLPGAQLHAAADVDRARRRCPRSVRSTGR